MGVRQSRYQAKAGKRKWICDYTDQFGKRHEKTFDTQKAANAFWAKAQTEVAEGTHTADADAITLEKARDTFIKVLQVEESAQATIECHKVNFRILVAPHLGQRRINRISPADVQKMLDDLRQAGRSAHALRRAKNTLGAILDEAIRQGKLAVNPVRSLRQRRRSRRAIIAQDREDDVVIPQKEEVRTLIDGAREGQSWVIVRQPLIEAGKPVGWSTVHLETVSQDKHINAILMQARRATEEVPDRVVEGYTLPAWVRPMIVTMAFAGIRIGEARGLTWPCVDVDEGYLRVEYATDKYNEWGPVKTTAARRTIPIGPFLVNTLRDWKKQCGKSDLDLVFPSTRGTVLTHSNVAGRYFKPLWIRLGQVNARGEAKYSPHSLRHFAVSLWIAQGANPHQVSKWVGHENVSFTMNLYAHLFDEKAKERDRITAAEADVMGENLGVVDSAC